MVKRTTNISRRAVRGRRRESLEEKRCKEKGKTYTVKAKREQYKRDFFYYFVYTLHIEYENINFIKQRKQTIK